MEKHTMLEKVMRELEQFYMENEKTRSRESKTLDYDYGFFDAMSVIRQMIKENSV